MADIREWSNLKCQCNGELFEPIVRLKFKTGGGTTSEPAGYRCVSCTAVVDQQYMIRLIEINSLKKQQAEIQAELDAKKAESGPAPKLEETAKR